MQPHLTSVTVSALACIGWHGEHSLPAAISGQSAGQITGHKAAQADEG